MSVTDLVIRGRRVVLPASSDPDPNDNGVGDRPRSRIAPAALHIKDGRIAEIAPYDDFPSGCPTVDANASAIVMPGLVDTHVHLNEPGRTEWEGFATATRAAAAGGVTTLVDMPLNSIPPTTTVAGLQTKLAAARSQCRVDVGFWGGVVPGNARELEPLFASGVVGFKCFLVHSGVDEFPNVTEADLREAMPELARLGAGLIVHAELPGPIEAACSTPQGDADPRCYATFLNARPRAAENEAVDLMTRLSREFGTKVHIVHHSSSDALPMLREAKASGLKITSETCPHYLCFTAEEIPDGATEYKCCPPIRERQNREELWQALNDGTIDMVVSDHSPCPPEMKCRDSGDFLKAWGGISSLQLRLPVMWTEARKRGHSVSDLVEWLCRAPARLVDLDQRKGAIEAGYDADIVIWNPEQEFRVKPHLIHHRHKLTPYAGRVFQGVVQQTFLRGQKVYDEGEWSAAPQGQLLHGAGAH
jgi:allantoinase